jgi:hypothetical protein
LSRRTIVFSSSTLVASYHTAISASICGLFAQPFPYCTSVGRKETAARVGIVDVWIGLWAPAKTPKEAVLQLAGWFTAALQTLEISQNLVAEGLRLIGGPESSARAGFFANVRFRKFS